MSASPHAKSPEKSLRWLILAHAYNVDGRAESLTITDKIPHIIAAGIQPVVLSSVMGRPDPHVEHHRLLPWGPAAIRFDLRHLVLTRFGKGWASRIIGFAASIVLALPIVLERLITGLRSQWSWAPAAVWQAERLMREQPFECVYSTGGVFSAHLAGAWLKARTGCRWIAEVHDPLVIPGRAPKGRHEKFLARLEARICRNADCAWWFTDGALAAARKRHPELGKRGLAILPGAEPPVVRAEYQPGPTMVLGHFGTLSPTRPLRPTLLALAELLRRVPQARAQIRLEIYGNAIDEPSKPLVNALGLGDVVVEHGRLEYDPISGLSGRARVMQRMQQVDVLLMLHGEQPESAEYIPSKLYDYFWARRPVLGLTCQNPQLDALITGHQGMVTPSGDAQACATVMASLLARWRANNLADVTQAPISVKHAVAQIVQAVRHG